MIIKYFGNIKYFGPVKKNNGKMRLHEISYGILRRGDIYGSLLSSQKIETSFFLTITSYRIIIIKIILFVCFQN